MEDWVKLKNEEGEPKEKESNLYNFDNWNDPHSGKDRTDLEENKKDLKEGEVTVDNDVPQKASFLINPNENLKPTEPIIKEEEAPRSIKPLEDLKHELIISKEVSLKSSISEHCNGQTGHAAIFMADNMHISQNGLVHDIGSFKLTNMTARNGIGPKVELENHGSSISENHLPSATQCSKGTSTMPVTLPKSRPHTCTECGKSFHLKHHLGTHMSIHTGERPHVCPECGKRFALKSVLSTHLLLHISDRPYKCPECSKTFTLKHHLVSHERVHTRDRPFECPECGRRFPQKRHLTTHIKFHSGERPFSCLVCGETFSREEHLVKHSRFHGGQHPFVCPDCGVSFLRKFELVNHERLHGRNPESCPACGKEFLQKRTLLVHISTCGLPPTPPSQATSPPPRYLEQAPVNKSCKKCGETFASVEGLALHLRLHVGDHSFLSDICSLAATLKQQAISTTVLGNKKSHICSDCGRGFSQKRGLFLHRQRYANTSCNLKPFSCEKCGKRFGQKNHLYLHERHHMNKPYEPYRSSTSAQPAEQLPQQQQQQQQQPPQEQPQPPKPDEQSQQRPEGTFPAQPDNRGAVLMGHQNSYEMDHHQFPDRHLLQNQPDRRHLEQLPVSLIQQPHQGQIDQHRQMIRQPMSGDMDNRGDALRHHFQRPTREELPSPSCQVQQAANMNFQVFGMSMLSKNFSHQF